MGSDGWPSVTNTPTALLAAAPTFGVKEASGIEQLTVDDPVVETFPQPTKFEGPPRPTLQAEPCWRWYQEKASGARPATRPKTTVHR